MRPRDAATVMLLRDGVAGLEVFMMQRSLASVFVAGAYVFPGGAVDPGDLDAEVAALCDGLDDTVASSRLGVPRGGLAFWVAAARETFEECGVLLARDAVGRPLDVGDPVRRSRIAEQRIAVDRGRLGLAEVCRAEGLRIAADQLSYFGRWITPEGSPRRYDTRFFVTLSPAGQTPSHDDNELIADLWVRPTEALARHADGDFDLILPTVRSLEAMGRFDSAAEALAAVEGAHGPGGPEMVDDSGGRRVLLPGDPDDHRLALVGGEG